MIRGPLFPCPVFRLPIALDEFKRELIVETLQNHDGKLQETADEIGIHRATLWRKMRKMKIA